MEQMGGIMEGIITVLAVLSITAIVMAFRTLKELDAEEQYNSDRYWKHTQDIEKLTSKVSAIESMMREAQISDKIKYSYVAKEDERRSIAISKMYDVDPGERQNGHA